MSGFQSAAEYAAALRAAHEDYRLGRVTVREHVARATALWSEILKGGLVDEVQAELARAAGE
jgi:hypothetical protein